MNTLSHQCFHWHGLSILRLLGGNKVAQGSLLLFLTTLLTSGINFLLMPLWTRLMTQSEYGVFGTILSYLGIIEAVAILGLHGALVRFYHDHTSNRAECLRALRAALLGIISFGGLIYLIGLFFAHFLLQPNQNGLQFWPHVPVALAASFFGLIITLYRSWCLARQEHLFAVLTSLALFVLITAVSLVLVWTLQWGAFGRIAGLAAGSILIGFALLGGPLRKVVRLGWDWQMLRPMLAFGIPIIPHSFAMVLIASTDRILLERFVGLEEAGRYTVVCTFTGALGMLIQSINSAWTPRYYEERNSETGDPTIRQFTSLWAALLALILPLFAWIGPPACRLMAGPSYASDVHLVAPLAVGVFFMGTYQFAINAIFYAKKSRLVPLISGIAAVISVTLNLLFIPKWGAHAAAYNCIASYAGLTVIAWWLSRKVNPQVGQFKTVFPWFVATAIVALLPWTTMSGVMSATIYLTWCGVVAFAFRKCIFALGFLRTLSIR